MEGWVEIEITTDLLKVSGGIKHKIKTCKSCKHLKRHLLKSGKNPLYIDYCSELEELHGSKRIYTISRLSRNVYNWIEPPGIDGEDCPFDQEVKRDLKLKNILNNGSI